MRVRVPGYWRTHAHLIMTAPCTARASFRRSGERRVSRLGQLLVDAFFGLGSCGGMWTGGRQTLSILLHGDNGHLVCNNVRNSLLNTQPARTKYPANAPRIQTGKIERHNCQSELDQTQVGRKDSTMLPQRIRPGCNLSDAEDRAGQEDLSYFMQAGCSFAGAGGTVF